MVFRPPTTRRLSGIVDVRGFGLVQSSCVLSTCEKYRYELTRQWDENLPKLVFILLNPSTATHETQDPTVRRAMGFARSFGYGGLCFVNLFAYRATNPEELKTVADPFGPENDAFILEHARTSALVNAQIIAAWGAHGGLHERDERVLQMLGRENLSLHALHLTKDGNPGHPLYLSGECKPFLWKHVGASGSMQTAPGVKC